MVKYLKPISSKIEELKESFGNGVFLVGEEGSGKTITLLEYVKQSKNSRNPVIDITPISIYSLTVYDDFAKLYLMCMILQKILLYIKNNYLRCYVEHFLFFNTKINDIQNDIIMMYNLGKYKIDNTNINKTFLNKPEILLEEFLNIAVNYLNYDNLTVVLDNFDVEMPYIKLYQTYIYELLKKYLKVIATISDPLVINNSEKLQNLSQNNTLIMMDYNRKVDTVKKILDGYFSSTQDKKIISRRISFLFKNSTIEEMIKNTNGNLFSMILALRVFFEHIKEIDSSEYDRAILNIINENLSFNSVIINRHRNRKLYL